MFAHSPFVLDIWLFRAKLGRVRDNSSSQSPSRIALAQLLHNYGDGSFVTNRRAVFYVSPMLACTIKWKLMGKWESGNW